MHKSGWVPSRTFIACSNNILLANPHITLNAKEWLKAYPYCAWQEYEGNLGLWAYLCKYRKNPKLELLVKAGYSNFVGISEQLDTNAKTIAGIFKVTQPFATEYLKYGNIQDLKLLRQTPWLSSEEELKSYKNILSQFSWYGKDYYADIDLKSEVTLKYLVKTGISPRDYQDYIRTATKLAYPLSQKSWRYPKTKEEFKTLHDKAANELKVLNTRQQNEKIVAFSNECRKLSYEKDGYVIFPLSSVDDLLRESEKLEHCVRTYADKVANRNCLILFVRKKDDIGTPLVTVELSRNLDKADKPTVNQYDRIAQVRGYKNSAPDDETKKFILEWKKKKELTGWTA